MTILNYSYKCKRCGKLFEIDAAPSKTLLCRSCAQQVKLDKREIAGPTDICAFCGKPFVKRGPSQIYCKGPHYRICPVCGKAYEEKNNENLKRPPHACSYECRAKKSKATSLEKYGCKAPGNNDEARKKAKATCKAHLGVDYAMQSPEVRQKSKETMIERYGVDNISKIPEVCSRRVETCIDKYGEMPFNALEVYEKQRQTMIERYGAPYYILTEQFQEDNKYIRVSKTNSKFGKLLTSAGIDFELEFRIDNRIYDFILPEKKMLIEIDPTYTHNSIGNHWDKHGMEKMYHVNKSKLALSNGFKCIHIFDWEDWNKIISLLYFNTKVYARQCKIAEVSKSDTDKFLDDNHLQGTCKGQIFCYGLFFNNELLEIMTFGKPRYNSKYQFELLRLCTKSGYIVPGGASKLFKHFVEKENPKSVISYCDASKFNGAVYEKIGMKYIRRTDPSKVWSKGSKKITDNLLRQRGFDQLFGTDFGKGTSNDDLMVQSGWLPVYDCGQRVYEWKQKV